MADEPAPGDRLTAELDYLHGRHREITLVTGEKVCDSDRHKWPCHAHRALTALGLLLTAHAAYVSRDERDRLAAIMAGDDDG